MKPLFVLLSAVGAVAMTTLAGPLDRKDVAASPALLVHVDADALRTTAVGRSVLADPDVQTKLGAVQAMFNFDFRTQLHGFTIYTTADHTEEPVLIIYADFDPDRLVALAKAFPGFQAETNAEHMTYNWIDEKKKTADSTPRIYASMTGHRLIFGKTHDALMNALHVIDGKADALTGDNTLLAPAPGELVVAEGMGLKLNVDNNNPSAAIFQASKTVRMQIGEIGDNVDARIRFDAKDEDAANQISAMINGLLALLKFQKDNPDLIRVANGINVKQDGVAVTLSAETPSADLVRLLQKGAEEEREKKERQHADDTNTASAGKSL